MFTKATNILRNTQRNYDKFLTPRIVIFFVVKSPKIKSTHLTQPLSIYVHLLNIIKIHIKILYLQ